MEVHNLEGTLEALGEAEGNSWAEKGSKEASSFPEVNDPPCKHLDRVLADMEHSQVAEDRQGLALGTAFLLSDGRMVDFVGFGTKDNLGLGVWIEG